MLHSVNATDLVAGGGGGGEGGGRGLDKRITRTRFVGWIDC